MLPRSLLFNRLQFRIHAESVTDLAKTKSRTHLPHPANPNPDSEAGPKSRSPGSAGVSIRYFKISCSHSLVLLLLLLLLLAIILVLSLSLLICLPQALSFLYSVVAIDNTSTGVCSIHHGQAPSMGPDPMSTLSTPTRRRYICFPD